MTFLGKQAPDGSLRWRELPAQRIRDPGNLEHFWNKWMHFQDLLGAGLKELIAVKNGHG